MALQDIRPLEDGLPFGVRIGGVTFEAANDPAVRAELAALFELQAGDLIFTGTPAGVGAVQRGDSIVAGIDGLDTLRTTIV